MKILIAGNTGAGKSTIARKIANMHGLSLCAMDNIVWNNGVKRSYEDRKKILDKFLKANDSWIVEGMSHKEWMHDVYRTVDYFFLLDTSDFVSKWRIIKLYFKKFGIKNGYRQTWNNVKLIFKARVRYKEEVIPEIIENAKAFNKDVIHIRNIKDIESVLIRSL